MQHDVVQREGALAGAVGADDLGGEQRDRRLSRAFVEFDASIAAADAAAAADAEPAAPPPLAAAAAPSLLPGTMS